MLFAPSPTSRERKVIIFRLPLELVCTLAHEIEWEEAPSGTGTARAYFDSVEDLPKFATVLLAAVKEVAQ